MLNATESFLLDTEFIKITKCITQKHNDVSQRRKKKKRDRQTERKRHTQKDKEIKETHCPVECLRSCYFPFSFVKSSYTL